MQGRYNAGTVRVAKVRMTLDRVTRSPVDWDPGVVLLGRVTAAGATEVPIDFDWRPLIW